MGTLSISRKANLVAGVAAILYLVPLNSSFTGNIRILNRNNTPVKITVAICTDDNPTLSDYIEYECLLPPNEPLEDTALILTEGERFYVFSDTSGVSVRVHGIEETP